MTFDKISITLKACSLLRTEKAVEKVVRPTQADTNDTCKCWFCLFQFSVKYGNFSNLVTLSSENLYKISLNNKCIDTKTLVELCEELGFSVPRCSRFSERICCKAFGRNLRGTHNFYNKIKSALEKEGDKKNKDVAAQLVGDLQAKELPCKRGLATTTISPERRSPQRKKVERAGVPPRKSLGFGGTSQPLLDRTLSDLSINKELVYFICSRTWSPGLWDVNNGESCIRLHLLS